MSLARSERGRDEPSSSRDLVLAHLGGDPTAFDDIVRWYYPALYGHARRNLRDEKLAEDAVQETFLRAYRALPAFAGEYQLGAWLHRIIANVCATEGAHRSRASDAEQRWSALPPLEVVPPEEEIDRREARQRVVAAIDLLPESYRDALVQRDILDLDYAEMADRGGITEDNARARVSRARAALRRLLEPSAALGALFGRMMRRASASLPRWAQQATNTATAMSDASTLPARASALTAVATTGIAAVAVAAAPIISSQMGQAPPAPPTAVAVVAAAPPSAARQSPSVTVRAPSSTVTPAVAVVPAPTSISVPASTTTTVTSTTIVAAKVVVAPSTTVAPAPGAVAALNASDVAIDSGGGATEGSATLSEPGETVTGRLITQFVLPSASAASCSQPLSARFLWTPPGTTGGNPDAHELEVNGYFTGVHDDGRMAVYTMAGTATVTGGSGAFDGSSAITGSVAVPDGASVGVLTMSFVEGTASTACAGASSPPTTQVTPVSTTEAPATTVAGSTAAPPTSTP